MEIILFIVVGFVAMSILGFVVYIFQEYVIPLGILAFVGAAVLSTCG